MRISKFLAIIMLVLIISALPCMAEVNEVDSNFDGKIDQWQYVNDEGKVEKIEHDGDFDGKKDQIEYFKLINFLFHFNFSWFVLPISNFCTYITNIFSKSINGIATT